jgi:hypothetical protein
LRSTRDPGIKLSTQGVTLLEHPESTISSKLSSLDKRWHCDASSTVLSRDRAGGGNVCGPSHKTTRTLILLKIPL